MNNAGIEIKKPFEDFTESDITKMMIVHFLGSWMLSQRVWPHMKAQKSGRLVMVCSSSIFGMKDNAAYTAAKGALLGLTKSLAEKGRAFGIYVNGLAPVAFTAMARQMLDTSGWDYMEKHYPASQISPVCCWLAHSSCVLTGQIVVSWGRNIGKIFLGETIGLQVSGNEYTIETIADCYEAASSELGYFVPESTDEEVQFLQADRKM